MSVEEQLRDALEREEKLQARVKELEASVQYRREPFESPSHYAERRPWHSPHCYEKSGSHRDRNLCTCGLTNLQEEVYVLRNEHAVLSRRCREVLEALGPDLWSVDGPNVAGRVAQKLAEVDAAWRERVKIRANINQTSEDAECWCGEPSAFQSGECLRCGREQLRDYEERKAAIKSAGDLASRWIAGRFGSEAAEQFDAFRGTPVRLAQTGEE